MRSSRKFALFGTAALAVTVMIALWRNCAASSVTLEGERAEPVQGAMPTTRGSDNSAFVGNEAPPLASAFSKLPYLDQLKELRRIAELDLDEIFSVWVSAGQGDRDLLLQSDVATKLSLQIRERPQGGTFLRTVEKFIRDESHPLKQRALAIDLISGVQSSESVALLGVLAESLREKELKGVASRAVGLQGTLSMGVMHPVHITPALVKIWSGTNDPYLMSRAGKAMLGAGSVEGVSTLLDASANGSDKIRQSVAVALLRDANVTNPRSLPELEKRLNSKSNADSEVTFITNVLVRMQTKAAATILAGWSAGTAVDASSMIPQWIKASDAPGQREAWSATLSGTVRNEKNRSAIEEALKTN